MGYPSAKYRVELMPLKLKHVLLKHGVSQVDLASAIVQSHGGAMNKTGMNLLLNWGQWPKTTPRSSVVQQASDYLRSRGVPDADVAGAFELDEDPIPLLTPGRPPAALAAVKAAAAAPTPDEDSLLLEPVMLKPQAKRHFKLMFDPFKDEPQSAAEVFFGDEQRYVVASLREAIDNTRMVALVGESGSGKTTLWSYMVEQYEQTGAPVHLIRPMSTSLTVGDGFGKRKGRQTGMAVLKSIVTALDPNATHRGDREMLTRQAHALLAEQVAAGQRCCIVFEEAHDLSAESIKQLKRFHEFKLGAFKRMLSIILLAQPELLTTLGRAGGDAREVANRLEIIRMLPLEHDLEAYITHRLARGAIAASTIFTPDAIETAQKILMGERDGKPVPMSYPLLVGNLLTRAMNIAAEMQAPKVDAAIVRDAKKRGD